MRPDLQQKLFDDFPLLYDRDSSIQESAMCFGFECGNGWYELIRELSEQLYPLIEAWDRQLEFDDYPPRAVQVKEKYGTLRFYMSSSTSEMENIIDEFEEKSEKICEICGKEGDIDFSQQWYAVRCDDHR